MLLYQQLILLFEHNKCDNTVISAFSNTDYTVIHFRFMNFYTTWEWTNVDETCSCLWISAM